MMQRELNQKNLKLEVVGGSRSDERTPRNRDTEEDVNTKKGDNIRQDIHFQIDAVRDQEKREAYKIKEAAAAHAAEVEHDNEDMRVAAEGNILVSTFRQAEEKIYNRELERRRIEYTDVGSAGLWKFMPSLNI